MHRPTDILFNFTVQQNYMGELISFNSQTPFAIPVPSIGDRVAFGPSNGAGDSGKALIGKVQKIQHSADVTGRQFRFSYVIDLEAVSKEAP